MKKISTLFIASLIAFSMQAQVAATSKNISETISIPSTITTGSIVAPEESLGLKETEFDFGKIPQGKPVTHIFDVENIGKDSLKISNVQASCGCTTPDWIKNKVEAPKEKTIITVGYNAAGEGTFNKTITITYNGNKTKQIIIKGEVWKTPATSAPENTVLANLKD